MTTMRPSTAMHLTTIEHLPPTGIEDDVGAAPAGVR